MENQPNYTFVKADICDSAAITKIFDENDIDRVVHFAAESHVDRSIKNPEVFVKTNVLGTLVMLNAAKAAWELSDGSFKEGKKFPCNITSCSNNYGPFQFPEKLIPLVINNALQEKSLPVYGDGKNVRDWLYVDDHAKAIDMVQEKGKLGERYNIGGHNEKQNIQIIHIILDTLQEMLPDKIKAEIGWYPETMFEEGIKKTIQWFFEHEDWMKHVTSGDYQKYYEEMYK